MVDGYYRLIQALAQRNFLRCYMIFGVLSVHLEVTRSACHSRSRAANLLIINVSFVSVYTAKEPLDGYNECHFPPMHPLFDSLLDDCTAYVFRGMIYADLNQNPLIVLLEILRGHLSSDRRA